MIIGKLRGIQVREGLNDEEMGKRLGCSRQTYNSTRLGKIPLGMKILKGISPAFPELKQDVEIFLSRDANNCPVNANNPVKRFFVGLLERIRK